MNLASVQVSDRPRHLKQFAPQDELQSSQESFFIHALMSSASTAVRFRLSRSQMSYIWPGLDLIAKEYSSHPAGKYRRFCYPFRLYPPASGFNRGKYNADLMSHVIEVRRRLRPKAYTGGRVQMDAIDIRAAILAIRVNLDWWRYLEHLRRKESNETKVALRVDRESLRRQKERGQRVIRSLERHMKRSNSWLLKEVGKECYDALMSAWRAHVRWIRLYLVYFKPRRIGPASNRKLYQTILDEFERIARIAIAEEGYEPRDAKELRRVMRLFAVSLRRGRQYRMDIPYVLKYEDGYLVKPAMADFVLKRLKLKRLPGY